jgi:hypothetical protein
MDELRVDRVRRRVVRSLTGVPLPTLGLFQRRRESLFAAQVIVRVFYAVALYRVCDAESLQRLLDATAIDPLWCVAWARLTGPALAGSIVYAASVLSAMACVLAPGWPAARIAFAAAMLEFGGLENSFGKISHGSHVLTVCAFLLCFLPSGDPNFIRRSTGRVQAYLLCVWSLLASFFLTYSISGVWKVAVGLAQAAKLEPNAFSPSALAYHVARRLLETGESTPLAHLLLRHPALGWPANLLTLYLETFAIVAAFRPRLHRLWALGLISFHLGSGLILGIGFYHHVLLLGVLGLASPFAPAFELRATLRDLPLFGDGWRWLSARGQAPRREATPLTGKPARGPG